MSDNLGTNQTRVLDSVNRSFESVIYQKRKPPLSCEWNLEDTLASEHAQHLVQSITPSGWEIIGTIKDNISESLCRTGDILTSPTANAVKLIAYDKGILTGKLIAWVNGWKILVQGTDSLSDENNVINLPVPPSNGSRIDFVFLEVWRKLITPEEVIYKYGNRLYGGTQFTNDLIDPSINVETSLRIQWQYRIRVASSDLESYPDGFDPTRVFVQGPLADPIDTCSQAYFSPVPGDPGLWRAGAGDSAAQEDLQTVDGYTYAIPMFAVHRRNTGAYNPDSRSNGAGKTVTDYLNGVASDRPDNKYNNWIVGDDILDMRHGTNPVNMKELCDTAFHKLITGKIRGRMEGTDLGEDHYGVVLVHANAVSDVDKDGSERITQGDGIRRIFSNAALSQPDSIATRTIYQKTVGAIGPWTASDAIQITTTGYPSGSTIASVEEVYTVSGVTVTNTVSGTGTATATVVITGGTVLTTSHPLTINYTIAFPQGPYGFTYLPERMLEMRKEDTTCSIASIDADIRVRTSAPVIDGSDGTHFNILANKGANGTEPWNFGHQMIYNVLGVGTAILTMPRTIEGYNVLGLSYIKDGTSYRTISSASRSSSQYSVSISSAIPTDNNVEVGLYLENKFFETNKQGRAVTDTFEMKELIPVETADGFNTAFTIDSTNRAIVALASFREDSGSGIAYVNGTRTLLANNNSQLPTDTTKTRLVINFGGAPSAGATIEVPVLLKSAIESNEGYTFFYERVPYQGLLDSSTTGIVEAVGPAISTTAGSGAIRDITYTTGKAVLSDSTTAVGGIGTQWLSAGIKSGYVINVDGTPSKQYIITSVNNETTLVVSGLPSFNTGVLGANYTITGKDKPFFNAANIIDRLPTYDRNADGSALNESISTAVSDSYPVLETRVISKVQDISDLSCGDATIGVGPALSGRGRYGVVMTENSAPLGLNSLGLKFEKLDASGQYQKTYQSYILNKENNGELYLMVVGSETDNSSASRYLNEKSTRDSVDIFELPGRPLTGKRTNG